MPLDGKREVSGSHAAPVVGNRDQRAATVTQHDVDPVRTGIKRVLDQFLHHAGRPFNHLAGGNAIDQSVRKPANPRTSQGHSALSVHLIPYILSGHIP